MTMADNSTLVSDTGRSLLADSSILDSKITETSKDNIFTQSASDVEGKRSQHLLKNWTVAACVKVILWYVIISML